MPWNVPPDYTVGQVLTAAEMDDISENLVYLQAAPILAGQSSNLVGTLPATGDVGFKIQAGTSLVMTDASANGTVTFPNAFTQGVLTVVICNGDTTTNMAPLMGAVTLSQFAFHCDGIGVADPASQNVRVNWIAIGV